MRKVKKASILVLLCCLIVAIDSCTKDKVAVPEVNTEVSFRNDIYPVFKSTTGHCGTSSCHTDAFSPPLFSSADSCYVSLTRDTSYNIAGYRYINRSSPDSSFLFIKLTKTVPPYGDRMPQGGPYLSEEFNAKVLAWIKQGAPNN